MNKTTWFSEARFGMFIHWGLYAIPAKGEWYMSQERVPDKPDYKKYFDEFNPKHCDIKAWIRLAKEAGMKYVVMTAKHHDGFCLYDSALTEYKSTNTQSGRDFILEFVTLCREENIKIGIYYSLLDWHHADYPKYNDKFHPMRGQEKYRKEVINWNCYLEYMHGQIRELCTNYGKIDLLWLDFAYDNMNSLKWKGEELKRMVKTLQPDILIDNRMEGCGSNDGSIMEDEPSSCCGDFASPEQCMPLEAMKRKNGEMVPWELCTTLNDSWGYTASDRNFKSPDFLIKKLVECVSKSGNMILNVGPDANGDIPGEEIVILKKIGEWMKKNGASIYGCEEAKYPRPDWGRYTKRGNKIYAHIMEGTIGPLPLIGIPKEDITNIRLLSDGSEPYDASCSMGAKKQKNIQYINFIRNVNGTAKLPDCCDTVVEITLKSEEKNE